MRHVKLILREEVPSLGAAGDLVRVKPGFARNYLIPHGKAILATESNVRQFAHHKRVVADKVAKELVDLKSVRKQLESLALEFRARVGEEGKLFGSVTAQHIADLLGERGFPIDRRKVVLAEPIREVGEHRVAVRLHPEMIAELVVQVSAEE